MAASKAGAHQAAGSDDWLGPTGEVLVAGDDLLMFLDPTVGAIYKDFDPEATHSPSALPFHLSHFAQHHFVACHAPVASTRHTRIMLLFRVNVLCWVATFAVS